MTKLMTLQTSLAWDSANAAPSAAPPKEEAPKEEAPTAKSSETLIHLSHTLLLFGE